MNIGLDLDEVTVELLEHIIKYYNLTRDKNLSKEDFYSYKFWEIWGGTRDEAIDIVGEFHSSEHFEKVPPVKDAIKSIKSLASKNKFFIITSRPSDWEKKTEKWVKKHLGDIKYEIIYTGDFHKGQGKSKSEVCIGKDIKVLLEDNGNYSLDCAKKGVKVILFDKPWNKKVKHKNVVRVFNWLEAVKEINNLSKLSK